MILLIESDVEEEAVRDTGCPTKAW